MTRDSRARAWRGLGPTVDMHANSATKSCDTRGTAASVLGIMVSKGSHWVIRSYLRRHAALFELLAVLDGSIPGSADARWTERQCARYCNVRYGLERDANITAPPTDQSSRAAATQLLLLGLSTLKNLPADSTLLEGRWILLAHPDEFYVQDVNDIVRSVSSRDPLATAVLFDIVYVMPTPEERNVVLAFNSTRAAESFEPIEHLAHCDAAFPFREPRLFKWTRGTAWGVRHSLTTPEVHPGHRTWPVARDVALRHSPFYVHFKVHDFSPEAFEVKSDRKHHGAWISFRISGFATGIASHRAHGGLWLSSNGADAMTQIFSYYERAGRVATSLRGEIRKRCNVPGVMPRCSLAWKVDARFHPRR